MDAASLRDRLAELARIEGAPTPVVSVYLDTRWADEHARERARIFLKNELRRVRGPGGLTASPSDLDWVETEGAGLISQTRFPDAHGVALFACHGLSLQEVIAVRMPFEDRLVVAVTPFLLPLSAVLEDAPAAVVVFVDAARARLVPLDATGPGEEVALEAGELSRDSHGGWAQMVESRYRGIMRQHRDRHFEAVAECLAALVEGHGVEWIVLAGEPRNLAELRTSLPAGIAGKIAGTVEGARHEPAAAFVARATELLGHRQQQRQAEGVDTLLTEAAKRRRAVAGLDETLDAINRGAVRRFYVAKGFSSSGHACAGCGALARGDGPQCRLCDSPTTRVELDQAMSDRVLAARGRVEVIDGHAGLARAGGVAALLRYAL